MTTSKQGFLRHFCSIVQCASFCAVSFIIFLSRFFVVLFSVHYFTLNNLVLANSLPFTLFPHKNCLVNTVFVVQPSCYPVLYFFLLCRPLFLLPSAKCSCITKIFIRKCFHPKCSVNLDKYFSVHVTVLLPNEEP